MKKCRRHIRVFGVAALLMSVSLSLPAEETSLQFPLQPWLQGPDRTAFPWKVKIQDPVLTYQQRQVVVVSGEVDGALLRKQLRRHLSIVVKFADKDGNWLTGMNQTDYEVPSDAVPDISSFTIAFYAGVYLAPGDYRVAVIVYDLTHKDGNVRHLSIRVPVLKKDPLPELGRDLPTIEFPARIPGMPDAPLHDPGWSLAHGVELLPIPTSRPIRIDVVVDVTQPVAEFARFPKNVAAHAGATAESGYYSRLKTTLEVASVLSHLRPSLGCVRVTAVDMSRRQFFLERQDGSKVDWNKLQMDFTEVKHAVIGVGELQKEHHGQGFAADFLTEVASDSTGCEDEELEPANHVVILMSHLFALPHAPAEQIQLDHCPRCRFIYLRVTPFNWEISDPYRRMLAPLRPRVFHFATPMEFRGVLQRLIRELGAR